ncbi:MAG: prephenate dehydrogenase/arogenate dehydrogenase family protein [Chloroflexota bacterium]
MQAKTISIIGLGRLGASVGLALKQAAVPAQIVGHDKDNKAGQKAKELGAVDSLKWNLAEAVAVADILIVAVPPSQLLDTLNVVGGHVQEHAVILDTLPLKGPGLQWARQNLRRGHYVGASPVLAADSLTDSREGLAAAHARLFQQSVICLMPSPAAEPKAVETAVNLGAALGAQPFFIDPVEYDALVEGVETLPGLMAAALFQAVTRSVGWRDVLRFAGAPFALMTLPLRDGADLGHLALQDRQATTRWLDALLEELQALRRLVAAGDGDLLRATVEELSLEREKWLRDRARNEWNEADRQEVEVPGFAAQLFGFRPRNKVGGK